MNKLLVLTMLVLSICVGTASAQNTAAHTRAEDTAHQVAQAGEPGHTADHGDAHAPAPLLPSNLHEAKEYFLGPAIWTLVVFVLLLAILYPTAWKQVLAGLKKREERIRGDIARAEADRRRADATLKQYNDQLAGAEARIRDMLAKATVDGEKLAANIRMQAQKEAEESKQRAVREIESSKNTAIREVHEQTAELATSIAAKILRRNLNADDQRELVRQSLDQLQTIK